MFVFLLLLLSHLATCFEQESSCNASVPLNKMSTKTDYELVGNKTNFAEYRVGGCQPIGTWFLSRHGARYPGEDEVVELNDKMVKIRDMILQQNSTDWLCDRDRELLRNWTSKMRPEWGNTLTPSGRLKLKELGQRYAARLSSLIKNVNLAETIVQTTNINRTKDSAAEFMKGFFESWFYKPDIKSANNSNDYLLKYPDLCENYKKTVSKNPNACPEVKEFKEKSYDYKIAINKFLAKLKIGESSFKPEDLFEYALKTCQYEYLIDNSQSVWCKFFDNATLSVMEYVDDVEYYCDYGYKHDIARLMTCDLVEDLVLKLRMMQKNAEKFSPFTKKVVLYFSHSSTLLTFYSILGLYRNPNDFNFENIHENINENRSWRVSKMDPMNANIAFILYNCNEAKSQYKIRVFHNENLVKTDGCQSAENCDLEDFIEYFQNMNRACGSTKEICLKEFP